MTITVRSQETPASSDWAPGHCLPQALYQSEDIFRSDMQMLLDSQWLLVDHESRIPSPGDYFLFEIGEESIIVLRSRSGAVNAFHNVCRHRGSRICLEPEGSKRILTCPYHAWSYDLDGRLRAANLMPEDFDREQVSLQSVNVGVFEGLIFLNAAAAPPPFEEFVAPFHELMRGQGVAAGKVGARKLYPTMANWKLVVENFFECYHCNTAHPTYCSVHDRMKMLAFGAGAGSGDDVAVQEYEEKLKVWEARSASLGYPTGMFADGPETQFFRSGNRLPISDDARTESVDGNPVAPLMTAYGEFDGGQTGCVFNPVSTILVNNDHAVIFRFTPRGPQSTDVEAIWVVRGDAREGADFRPEELMRVWDTTLREDKTITENNQKGVKSSAYRPGRYSTQEKRISEFVDWYMGLREQRLEQSAL